MPHYLLKATYTVSGIEGVSREGGTGRSKAVEAVVKGLGGRIECQYWALGDADYYGVVELPDNVAAAAISLGVGKSGAASVSTIALLTAAEMDEATKRKVTYRPPGK